MVSFNRRVSRDEEKERKMDYWEYWETVSTTEYTEAWKREEHGV